MCAKPVIWTDRLLQDLKDHDIVVMPGYVAIGDNDRPALLGQGGADLTALYVTQQLKERGAGDRAVLLKDVDGVYDRDPRSSGPEVKRHEALSFDDARDLTKVLIAEGALAFAKKHDLAFELGTPGIPFYTRIGAATSVATPLKAPKKMRVAMLGAGVMILGHFITENVILGDMSEVLNLPPRIWVLGIALAFFSTLLPSFMVNLAISKVGPQATSAVGMIAPISTIMLAIFVLGEPFGILDGVGTLITVAGIGLYTHFDRRAVLKL